MRPSKTTLATGLLLGLGIGAAHAVPLTNADFETPAASPIVVENSTSTLIFADGWTWSGPSGILNGTTANPFQGSTILSGFGGAQYAYLQGDGTSIVQGFTLAADSNVTISWESTGRTAATGFDGATTYTVTAGGLSGAGATLSGAAFASQSLSGVLAAGSYSLTFQNTSGAGDHTMYLDDIVVTASAVPEPGAFGLLGLGVGALAGCRIAGRRRTSAATAA